MVGFVVVRFTVVALIMFMVEAEFLQLWLHTVSTLGELAQVQTPKV